MNSRPKKTEEQPGGRASQAKLERMLKRESITMGREVKLVRFVETPEGIDLIVYDLEPFHWAGKVTEQRRWAVYFDDQDHPQASGIVKVEITTKEES